MRPYDLALVWFWYKSRNSLLSAVVEYSVLFTSIWLFTYWRFEGILIWDLLLAQRPNTYIRLVILKGSDII